MPGPYTLNDATGAPIFSSFTANSDNDAIFVAQAKSTLLQAYVKLITSTPNPLYPPVTTPIILPNGIFYGGGPPNPASFTPTLVYEFRPQPLPTSAWRVLSQQLSNLSPSPTPAQQGEVANVQATLTAAGVAYDAQVTTPGTLASLLAAAWAVNTAQPAWNELDRLSRAVYAAFKPAIGSTVAVAFGVTATAPTPIPLPFDPTLATQSVLLARYAAALSIVQFNAPYATLLAIAIGAWNAAVALQYPTPAATAALNSAAAQALATATLYAQVFIATYASPLQ